MTSNLQVYEVGTLVAADVLLLAVVVEALPMTLRHLGREQAAKRAC
jgi:hypothetical protein